MLKQKTTLILFIIIFPLGVISAQSEAIKDILDRDLNFKFEQNVIPTTKIDFLDQKIFLAINSPKIFLGDVKKIDSIVISSISGSINKLTFLYDKIGKITSYKVSLYLMDNSYIDGLQKTMIYDSSDHIISVMHSYWDGKDWVNWISEKISYNTQGQIIEVYDRELKNNEWINLFKINTTYSDEIKTKTSVHQEWDDSVWVDYSKTTTECFPNWSPLTTLYQVWQNNEWSNKNYAYYEYDANNRLAVAYSYSWEGDGWSNPIKGTFSYTLYTNPVCVLAEQWENNNWLKLFRTNYSYNAENNFESGSFEGWGNDNWLPADGPIHLTNQDGFKLDYFAHEMQVYYDGTTSVNEIKKTDLSSYKLSQNFPNPFNPSTTINFQIPSKSFVTLKVYDVLGNEVAVLVNEWKETGSYTAQFSTSGKQLQSGVYFYQLRAGNFAETKKCILLK